MAFPINPSSNQEYTIGTKTYKWNGSSWSRISTAVASLFANSVTTNAIVSGSITSAKLDQTFLANLALVSNLSSYATTTHVTNEVANIVASAPSALNTLNELAIALANDASFATTVTNSLSNKANVASLTTANVTEVTNLYFTNTRAISALTPGSGISIAANGRITGASQYGNTDVQLYLGNISGALVPSADELYNLGTSTRKWANLFLSGNTIVLGQTKIESSGDGSIAIKSTNTQVSTAISFSSNGYIAAPSGPLATATGSVSVTPRIANVRVTDSSYNYLDDTAANSQGYIEINGANFDNGATVIIGSLTASTVSFVNSSRLRASLPVLSAGTYAVYVINSDGATATRPSGLSISGTPIFYPAAGNAGINYEGTPVNIAVNAFSDTTITYTLLSGSLPANVSLNANTGIISGNIGSVGSNTTYNFTINATDQELQNTTRAFSYTTLNDPITWNNPSSTCACILPPSNFYSLRLSANNLSGFPLIYAANCVPCGTSICSNGYVFGTISNETPSAVLITSVYTANTTESSNILSCYYCLLAGPLPASITVLLVAGGGGSGAGMAEWGQTWGGGGGAGGFLCCLIPYGGGTYTVTVGTGGSGGQYFPSILSTPGSPSCIVRSNNPTPISLKSCGGGGGANWRNCTSQPGGSGGGGSTFPAATQGSGIPGQGNPGGAGQGIDNWGGRGGGGGGAGGSGVAGPTATGGIGCYTTITGANLYLSKGGGGGIAAPNCAGAANSGHGGELGSSALGVSGGSGAVYISYPTTGLEATTLCGGTCSTVSGQRVYCFLCSGCLIIPS